ncbi:MULTISPECIES: D-2-hydroxyacid dehydrogenase [unclassified Butyrivibrio]|uniref:D-2-hydroxyacid dehydrogenase n=1 Tax=unclassified Butyrivibrio TaxID=2639466 RepID=UPI0003B41C60|nr:MULTISPECIES: D-2-hydroxyacid dehydrogenase [unclassified Butyrivibrio]MDC7292470.1 D-2-hydroxyacid dehydrogenase [Butyrivibrio sp. DSM 10294]
MRIVVADTDSIGQDMDYSIYDELGEVVYYEDKITEDNAKERMAGAKILMINKSQITDKLLDDAPDLELICEFATGFDNANIPACDRHGVKVANVVNYSTASVAQHTFAMLFYLMEKLRHYDEFVKRGDYAAQSHFCCLDIPFEELDGKTYGIVGMGNIGKKVAQIATAYGAKVIFYASSGSSDCTDYEQVSFDELLKRSDVISLHCPLSDRTRNLFNKEAFDKMKPTAILINVARGAVVSEQDLADALLQGKIRAAGLDVLNPEPMAKDSPLLQIQDSGKLIVTPHLAWASTEARTRCLEEVKKNAQAWINGNPRNLVN